MKNALKTVGVHVLGCSLLVLAFLASVACLIFQLAIPIAIIAAGIYFGVQLAS